jgi:hypothetical protein
MHLFGWFTAQETVAPFDQRIVLTHVSGMLTYRYIQFHSFRDFQQFFYIFIVP